MGRGNIKVSLPDEDSEKLLIEKRMNRPYGRARKRKPGAIRLIKRHDTFYYLLYYANVEK